MERLKNRRKQTHDKHTISIRRQLIDGHPKVDPDQKTELPEVEETSAMSSQQYLAPPSARSRRHSRSREVVDDSDKTIRTRINSKPDSELKDSEFISNKENLLGSLIKSEMDFSYNVAAQSERQAMEFIQNVEEGMKEYAIIQENEDSIPTSSETGSKNTGGYEETQDVLITSGANSLDATELKHLLQSRDQARHKNGFNIADQFKTGGLETANFKDSGPKESHSSEGGSLHKQTVVSEDSSSVGVQENEQNAQTPQRRPTLAESNFLEDEEEQMFETAEEQFLSEVQEPKQTPDYMPVSYQNSVRNNKLMSELITEDAAGDSKRYFDIQSNGVSLKNSGLMMDLGVYEMYKESNLMSNTSVQQGDEYQWGNVEGESDLMSNLDLPPNEEILMSAIQMRDSLADDQLFLDPKNSLDELKAKIISNSELTDSSIFSRREIDQSKQKTLQFNPRSSQEVPAPGQEYPPMMSEKQHLKPFSRVKEGITSSPHKPSSSKFTKGTTEETEKQLAYEEIQNEDEIFLSSLEARGGPADPHLIMETLIPEHGLNIRSNNLQDSLTTYNESQKQCLLSSQADDVFRDRPGESGLQVGDDTDLEKQQREIEKFERLIESRLSQMEEKEQFTYRGSDGESDEDYEFNAG